MPLYNWQGVTLQGESCQGKTFASSYQELEQELLRTHIGLTNARSALTYKISTQQREAFFTHLAALLCAHIPLYQSLTTVALSSQGYLREVITDIAHRVAQGKAVSTALALHAVTDDVSHPLIIVGEQTGTLGQVLKQYVIYQEQVALLRSQIRQALIGPVVTLSFFMVTLMSMIFFVLPQFSSYYHAYGIELPYGIQVLLGVRSFLVGPSLVWALLGVLLAVVGIGLALRTYKGRLVYEWVLTNLPGIGALHRAAAQARIIRVLGMLLTNGVRLAQALQAAEAVTSFLRYKHSLAQLRQSVVQGNPLSQAWKDSVFTDPEIEALLVVGQTSGNLGAMVLVAAESKEKKLEQGVTQYVQLINPVLLVVLALGVGGLIMALYLPLITLSSSIG